MVEKAKKTAFMAHYGQLRKDSKEPFLTHLVAVNEILNKLTDNENILAIGWLHDIIEDTTWTFEDLKDDFPVEVLLGVAYETEDKTQDWYTRKITHIKEFNNISKIHRNILLVAFADKLSNIRDLSKLHDKLGTEKMFVEFNNKNPKEQYWYYNNFLHIFKRNLDLFEKDMDLLKEYENILNKIWG